MVRSARRLLRIASMQTPTSANTASHRPISVTRESAKIRTFTAMENTIFCLAMAMVFLAITITGAALLRGKKLGALFRV